MPPRRFSLLTALTVTLAILAGCEKEPPHLEAKDVVGTWIEIPNTLANPRMAPPPRLSTLMRKLTCKEDGTFELTLSNPDGTGGDPKKAITGKWRLDTRSVVMEVSQNGLGERFKDWAPGSILMDPRINPADPSPTECTVIHTDNSQVRYKRK